MKKLKNKAVAVVLSMATVLSCMPVTNVYADSQRIITLGADLSEEQKDTVLSFFGVSENNLEGIELLTITNQDEHALLDNVLPSSVIGSKTYSCAYIEPTTSGGVYIRTANLTYVTNTSLYNALQTAGVENCNLLVTAPFEVSGTGALTGVFKAFESTGKALDEDKQEVAAEELIIDAELESTYGVESADMVSDIKEEVVSSKKDLTEEDIEVIISDTAKKYEITLSTEDMEKIVELMGKLQTLEYDVDAFSTKMTDIMNNIEGKAKEAEGLWDKIAGFFESIVNFFKGLFGETKEQVENSPSIFDNVDTSIFEFDDEKEDKEDTDSSVSVSPTVSVKDSESKDDEHSNGVTPIENSDEPAVDSTVESAPAEETSTLDLNQQQENAIPTPIESTEDSTETPVQIEEGLVSEDDKKPTPTPTTVPGEEEPLVLDFGNGSNSSSVKIPEGVEDPVPSN